MSRPTPACQFCGAEMEPPTAAPLCCHRADAHARAMPIRNHMTLAKRIYYLESCIEALMVAATKKRPGRPRKTPPPEALPEAGSLGG